MAKIPWLRAVRTMHQVLSVKLLYVFALLDLVWWQINPRPSTRTGHLWLAPAVNIVRSCV